jgi:voltage-gated potassium channel
MRDHYIICGFGRVGHQVARDLDAENIPYVIVDIKEKTAEELEEKGVPYIIGDVTAENLLENAGVERAKGMIAANDSDVANVYVTLSARALNKNLFIVARASTKAAEEKLKTAGANKVISPYYIAGRRLAALAIKPVASDFLDTVMHGEHLEFGLQEIPIDDQTSLIGKSLGEIQVRQQSGATILAIRRADGGFDLQPLAGTRIEKNDILVAIGTQEQLDLLAKMAR